MKHIDSYHNWKRLHESEDPYIVRLKKLALNPTTSEDLLQELATHSDGIVRMCVARNPITPVNILKQQSQDPSSWVRLEIAKNPNVTLDILLDLLMDPEEYVVKAARKSLPSGTEILGDIF
jgi:hypothetical protein